MRTLWKRAIAFDDFARVCCGRVHMRSLDDHDSFSMSHRVGRLGPATVAETAVESHMSVDAGELCGA